jgi:hypothetical protein
MQGSMEQVATPAPVRAALPANSPDQGGPPNSEDTSQFPAHCRALPHRVT